MSELFLKIVNMSISASWIVLAILILRLLLKKAPKWISVVLWGIVAVRLICPISIESVMSLIPSAETISPEIMTDNTPTINSGITFFNNAVNPIINGSLSPDYTASVNPLQVIIPLLSIAWIVGVVVLILYTIFSYWRVKVKVSTAVLLRDNVFQTEKVASPFVLGMIKPKIYLPFNMSERDIEHVIAHENAHIRRKDYLWKPFGFLILTLHWFNPLIWLGYVLLCKDIELACDEKVIKELDIVQKADYSQALLTCSINRRTIAACPLAFGEVGVKARVKSVLNYKKPAFWVIIIAVVVSLVTAVCFLTNPKTTLDDELSVFLDMQIAEHHSNYGKDNNDNFIAVHHKVLDVDRSSSKTIVYMWVMYREYSCENGQIKKEADAHIPTVITVKRTGSHGHYKLVEYWEPHDGELYAGDIKGKFPLHLHEKALNSQRYVDEQSEFCDNAARKHFYSVSNIGGADGPQNEIQGKRLTLDKVKALAKKGNKLRWEDFDGFSYSVTGSGLYIRYYEIDEMFSLSVGGTNPDEDAWYFYLNASDVWNERIDIRTEDVEKFISDHKNNPVVKNVTWSYYACPVDFTCENFGKMIGIGGMPTDAILSSKQSLATVKISSVKDLQNFRSKMKDTMNFDLKYSDVVSFNEACEEYTDEYFKNTSLYLVYAPGETPAHRLSIEYAKKSQGVLSIGIMKSIPDTFAEDVMQGWLVCISVPSEDLKDVERADSYISSTNYPNSGTADAKVVRSYLFADSKEVIKPSFTLYDNGKFTFTFSGYSSYLGFGDYELENGKLTLKTADGQFVYCFYEKKDRTMVFDAENSSEMVWYSGMYDGCVFK